MSLGLRLRAEFASPIQDVDDFMKRVQAWIRSSFPEARPKVRIDELDGYPALFCRFHPAAEELDLTLFDAKHIVVSANTTTVGPGYHAFLSAFLKTWAMEFKASWETPDQDSDQYGDETGFFFTGDEDRLRNEMLAWLEALCKMFFDGSLDTESAGIHLCMPLNPHFESDQPAITALGPRDRRWLYETSQDGTRGRDFFAWWMSGFNAEYYLRSAVSQMWCDVRWRKPLDEAEKNVLQDVADCLQQAFRLDPSLVFPWAEWSQILELLDDDRELREIVSSKANEKPTIGYRRSNVQVALPGGWSIRLPGSFSEFMDGSNGAIYAIDPPSEIWFTAFRSTGEDSILKKEFAAKGKEILGQRPENLIERDGYIAVATFSKREEGGSAPRYVLTTSNYAPGNRSICTMVVSTAGHKDWALETWNSIQPPSHEAR